MSEEVDLRPYILAILERWRWIIGGAIVAGLLAFGLSFLLPPVYEAAALVLVVSPDQMVEFDPRFEAIAEARPVGAYPELAVSDSILRSLSEELPSESRPETLQDLRQMVSARANNDPGLLRLSVEDHDAESAAAIANAWAELFLSSANVVLGDQDRQQVAFYIDQREAARQEVQAAEEALADFQATNRTLLLQVRLDEMEEALAANLRKQRELDSLRRDIATLRDQLQAQDGDVLSSEQLAILLLQLRTYEGSLTSTIELQFEGAEAAGRGELVTALDALEVTLGKLGAEIAEAVEALEPEVLAVQEKVEVQSLAENELRQEVELSTETYTALARKVAEEEITSQDVSRGLRLAAPAIAPEEPGSPRPFLNGMLGAVVGIILLTAVTVFLKWRTV